MLMADVFFNHTKVGFIMYQFRIPMCIPIRTLVIHVERFPPSLYYSNIDLDKDDESYSVSSYALPPFPRSS